MDVILKVMVGAIVVLTILCLYVDVSKADRSRNTRYHCEADYVAYCGDIKAYTPKARACMRRNKWKLSLNCRKALGKAGYRG